MARTEQLRAWTGIIAACLVGGVLPYAAGQKMPGPNATPSLPAPRQVGVPAISLDELVQLGLAQNPRLAQAAFAIDNARGRAWQAGLYPNPTVSVNLDELGDRTGPGGVNTIPLVTQEIITAGKRRLDRSAGFKEVDQATLTLAARRYTLLGNIRQTYFEVVALQRRVEILAELVKLSEKSVEQTQTLFKAEQVAELDLVQLEVERERLRAEEEATRRELPAAYHRLAAVVGVPRQYIASVAGTLEGALPPYELERAQQFVLEMHPEILSARAGVEQAQLLLRRAEVEPIPNVTVGAGYVRQNQNRSDDWTFNVSVPVPVWNRNQGNIAAARARVGQAIQEVGLAENDLADRLAVAFRDFAAARRRAENYRTFVLPRAQQAYDLSARAYKGGLFEYLRVLEAQRSVTQARLEVVRSLGEAWRAAGVISGLTLEDQWPPVFAPCDGK